MLLEVKNNYSIKAPFFTWHVVFEKHADCKTLVFCYITLGSCGRSIGFGKIVILKQYDGTHKVWVDLCKIWFNIYY